MKKTFLIALCFIALPMSTMAQLISLSSTESRNKLWLDPNRIYDYNLYEKSRWGLGLQYDINFKTEKELNAMENPTGFKTLSFSGYGAYGYGDQRFKWGLKADLQGASTKQSHTYLEISHDLTADASRTLSTPDFNILRAPASFMTNFFSDSYRLTLGHSRKITKRIFESLELRLSRERPLHDDFYLFYPASYSELKDLKYNDYIEGLIYVAHTSGWSAQLIVGTTDVTPLNPFSRLLVQYDHHFYFSFLNLGIFAQAGGVVSNETPYSRMFDLGGTWGSPLLLNHALLTARVNEFTANVFSMVNLKLTTRKPLAEFYNKLLAIGTSPQPFLLCNAAWGYLWEQTNYIAPDRGIAEVGAGIDGLLVWGEIHWGFGVVYRLTPEAAPYHFSDPKDNLTYLFTAYLDL